MKKQMAKRGLAVGMVIVLALTMLTSFTNYNGFGTVYYEAHKTIFDGVTYTEQIGNHSINGMEHAYMVQADFDQSSIMPIVFNGEVRGTYTVGSMIKYAEEQGYKVVAAINGDIYDMATGTPQGTVIHDGNIVTSGYAASRVIAFDNNGKASLKYVDLTYWATGSLAYETKEEGTGQIVKVEAPFNRTIDYYNVQYGAAKGLHLYNRHYATSTKTSGSCVEAVIQCQNTQLTVNGTITGTVLSVNSNTSNTPITDNTVVLSTVAGSASASDLSCLVVGSQIEISVADNNGGLQNAKEALGIFHSIVENGSMTTNGTGLNPRTAVGIKKDGSILLYELDGRLTAAKGLNMVDLANHLISLGCVSGFNMDGGGSAVLYSRLPGLEATATRKSTPSEGSERKVSNAILLVYKETASSSASKLHVYPELTLAMPGADVQLSTYATNSLYEKASLPGTISYSVADFDGTVSNSGLFTAGTTAGRVTIEASSGSLTGDTEVDIVKDITFTPSVAKVFVEPDNQIDIDIVAKVGTMTVNSKDSLFTWACSENIGTIDQNGLFTAGSKTAQEGNITVSYNGVTVTIPTQVGALSIDFLDTKDHWAKEYIGSLAARNIINGMGNNLFAPDTQLTRAQFLTMLAKTNYNLDVKKSLPAGFTDVNQTDWYYDYVNWGYANGIVNGLSDTVFAPDASITREQMAIMLCKFATSSNMELEQVANSITFTDAHIINSWSIDYVNTVVGAGIMGGYPEGNFAPQGNATRAEAAKVIYVFSGIKDGIIVE